MCLADIVTSCSGDDQCDNTTVKLAGRNFRVLWFGSLITDLGNAMTLPFIVLYIQTLGDYSTTQLNFLGAAAFAVTYACKALVAP
ncbi:hypothetical protein WP50_35865, partial [Lactiplantibacillus plantarum]